MIPYYRWCAQFDTNRSLTHRRAPPKCRWLMRFISPSISPFNVCIVFRLCDPSRGNLTMVLYPRGEWEAANGYNIGKTKHTETTQRRSSQEYSLRGVVAQNVATFVTRRKAARWAPRLLYSGRRASRSSELRHHSQSRCFDIEHVVFPVNDT